MFSYEFGLVVALLLWLYYAVMLIVSINSQFERNLNRIGQRLSWSSMRPQPMDADDLNRSLGAKVFRYLLIVGFALPFVLTSWLYVLFYLATLIYLKAKDAGAPQLVKEYRWKLRNLDLSFDQLVKETMKVNGDSTEKFEEIRAYMESELRERGVYRG